MQNSQYLVLLDTDKIHDYIFATNKLKEIWGASAILDELNIVKTKEVADKNEYKAKRIYVGGGAAKYWFSDNKKAEKFCNEIENIYFQRTLTASVTTCIEKRIGEENFQVTLDRAERKIRNLKSKKMMTTQINTNSYFKFCELCGIYPASTFITDRKKWICNSCNFKKQTSSYRISIYDDFIRLYGKTLDLEANFPSDFSEISNACRSNGYLGFIYADGNGMGKILHDLLTNDPDNECKLADFSNAIDKATKEGIIKAVLKHIPEPIEMQVEQRGRLSIFPIEFIIAGGDDLVIAVPASKALQIAIDFAKNFEEIFKNEYREKNSLNATISCGVAITKSTFPINLLFKLAGELLKSAKKLSKEELINNDLSVSTIDFSILSSSSTQKLEKVRVSEYKYQNLYLTERPYKLDVLKSLINFAVDCKKNGLANRKIINLRQSLFKGKEQATLEYIKFLTKFRNDSILKKMFIEKTVEMNFSPWRKIENEYNKYSTPFLDIVEIYDFVTADVVSEEEI